jgi:hypothetical protein
MAPQFAVHHSQPADAAGSLKNPAGAQAFTPRLAAA